MNYKRRDTEDETTLLNDNFKARLRGRFQDLMKGEYELKSNQERPNYLSEQKIKRFSSKSNNPSQAKPSFNVNEGYAKSPSHHASNTPSVQETSYIVTEDSTVTNEPAILTSTPKKNSSDNEDVAANVRKSNRRKKSHKKADDPSTSKINESSAEAENLEEEIVPSSSSVLVLKNKAEVKKKKKRTLPKQSTSDQTDKADQDVNDADHQQSEEILGIVIHHASKIKSSAYVSHPVVQIHILNLETGNYLRKQNSNRSVSSFYETQHGNVDYIMPVMTQPCKSFNPISLKPIWEELVLFNEDFNYFINDDPRVIIFFEILDFVSPNSSPTWYSKHFRPDRGWYRIAWAFLIVKSSNGTLHVSKKVQLQLFKPLVYKVSSNAASTDFYKWWKSGLRNRMDGTLFVTVKPITPPRNIEPSIRSFLPIQEEHGRATLDEELSGSNPNIVQRSPMSTPSKNVSKELTEWSRLPGQACKVPTQCFLSFATDNGCFTLQFSHNGRSIACGNVGSEHHEIVIYQLPSGLTLSYLKSHSGLIYDLDWASDDSLLLSSSADGTARVWDVARNVALAILPHPCFVYAAKFHPLTPTIIVTGSFDKLLRIWCVSLEEQVTFELLQELSDHESHINDICWDYHSSRLYSADNSGCLLVWNSLVNQQLGRKGDRMMVEWQLEKKVVVREIKGIPINSISLHPSGRKLLLHCRDSVLRLLDINAEVIIRQYSGIVNFQYLMKSCFSPCGTLISSGSEDGTVYIWYSDTGQTAKVYTDLPYKGPITCVKFHPHDNYIAMCAGKQKSPVLIYGSHNKAESRTTLSSVNLHSSTRHLDTDFQYKTTSVHGKNSDEDEGTYRIESSRSASNDLNSALHKLESSLTFGAAVEKTIRLQRIAKKLDSVLHVEKKDNR